MAQTKKHQCEEMIFPNEVWDAFNSRRCHNNHADKESRG